MTIGQRLQVLRRATKTQHGRRMSQQALADGSGVSRATIAELERGARTSASLSTLEALAGGLGIGVDRLVSDDDTAAA